MADEFTERHEMLMREQADKAQRDQQAKNDAEAGVDRSGNPMDWGDRQDYLRIHAEYSKKK